jgi:hypothetical protein
VVPSRRRRGHCAHCLCVTQEDALVSFGRMHSRARTRGARALEAALSRVVYRSP